MKIEDRLRVPAPRQAVWDFIRNPEQLAPCVPGCSSVEVLGDNRYKAAVGIAIGPIKASFNVEITVTEEQPPLLIKTSARGEEGSRASTVASENILRLEEVGPEETELVYSSEVSVVGRLGKFGLGIMKKKAESLGREFAQTLSRRLLERRQAEDLAGHAA